MPQAALSRVLYEKMFAHHIDRDHLRDQPGAATRGNLFEPKPPHGMKGGWKEDRETLAVPPRWTLVLAGAAIAMFAATAAARMRK